MQLLMRGTMHYQTVHVECSNVRRALLLPDDVSLLVVIDVVVLVVIVVAIDAALVTPDDHGVVVDVLRHAAPIASVRITAAPATAASDRIMIWACEVSSRRSFEVTGGLFEVIRGQVVFIFNMES